MANRESGIGNGVWIYRGLSVYLLTDPFENDAPDVGCFPGSKPTSKP
jgi:hypothetical protein